MFVCSCAAVTDAEIRESALGGARTVDEVGDHCYAGTGCGGCRERIQEILTGGRVVGLHSRSTSLPRSA